MTSGGAERPFGCREFLDEQSDDDSADNRRKQRRCKHNVRAAAELNPHSWRDQKRVVKPENGVRKRNSCQGCHCADKQRYGGQGQNPIKGASFVRHGNPVLSGGLCRKIAICRLGTQPE